MRARSRRPSAVLWIGLATLVASPATALVPVGTSFPLAGGGSRDAAASNGLLYFVSGTGLQIVDVHDPAAGYTAMARLPGSFTAIEVDGARAFLVGASGLTLVDVSDPAAPAPLGAQLLTGAPVDVAVAGTRAYVAVNPLGLRIADVSNPAAPALLGSLDLEASPLPPQPLPFGSAARVIVAGGAAYLFSHRGLDVVDVRDPAAPRWITTIDLVPGIHGAEAAVRNGFLYLSGRDPTRGDRIHILDVSDPAAPRYVGAVGSMPYFRFAIDGDTLYADNGLDFQAFDVSDPTAVEALGVIASPGNIAITLEETAELVVADGLAHFVIAPLFGPPWASLRGVSLEVPDSPKRVRRAPGPDAEAYEAMAVAGDLLFGVYADRFEVNSIASPLEPVLLASLVLPGFPYDIAIADQIAYVASETNLAIVSVADPAAPRLLSTLAIEATAVARAGNRLYVGTEDGEAMIYDIADRTRPVLLSSLDVALPAPWLSSELNPIEVYDLELDGDVLYVATLIGVRTVDVSNPATPVSIGTFSIPASSYLRNMALSGSLLFVGGIGGARIIDASDPAHLREIKKLTNFGLYDLQVVGDRLLLSGVVVNVYDVSQPSEPRAIGGALGGGGALAIAHGIAYAGSVSVDAPLDVIEFGPEYGLTAPAAIDIVPNSRFNAVDPKATRFLTVALLGSDTLDVADVVRDSLVFGPDGAHAEWMKRTDANHDQRDDLLAVFRLPATGIVWSTTRACLSGETTDGLYFGGCDRIHTVGECGSRHSWRCASPWCSDCRACWPRARGARAQSAYCIRN